MRKPDFAYAETKAQISCVVTAQLLSYKGADCFRHTNRTTTPLAKSDLCRAWTETPNTGFLAAHIQVGYNGDVRRFFFFFFFFSFCFQHQMII